MQVHFLTYPADGGGAEELGPWNMAVPPARGDIVTIQGTDGSATAWVVQQIVHHVTMSEFGGVTIHQIDAIVDLASEMGVSVPERSGPGPERIV